MKSKKTIIILILVLTIGIVGLTIAYFANTSSIDNVFTTHPYGTTVTEKFISPSNWLPGSEVEKSVIATNTGNVDEAIRIKLNEIWTPYNNGSTLNGWIHEDGSKSSHTTESELANDERVAIINFDNDSDWYYEDGYYYYKYKLGPNVETSSLIKSVTFNPNTKLDDTCVTTTNGSTKTITCNSSGSDYDNAKYTLTFTIETVQYDKYASAWKLPSDTMVAIGESKPQGVNFAQAIMSKSNALSVTNYTDGVTTEAYTFEHAATEQTPALTDYRYIGASPNNYVEFNCDDNGENCEIWRAIGVFYVDDGNNNWEWRVKLVRGSSLNEGMQWDDRNGTFEGGGINDWTGAKLNTFLNSDYYNSVGDASTYGLKISSRSMIENAKYYLGGSSYDSTIHFGSSEEIYIWERGINTFNYENYCSFPYYTECQSENYCNDNPTDEICNASRTTNWIGRVGLLYPSDVYLTYKDIDTTCYNDPYNCTATEFKWNEELGMSEKVYKNPAVVPKNSWIYNSNNIQSQNNIYWIWLLYSKLYKIAYINYKIT